MDTRIHNTERYLLSWLPRTRSGRISLNLRGQNIHYLLILLFCHSHLPRYICTRKTIAVRESRYIGHNFTRHVKFFYVTGVAKLSKNIQRVT